MSFADILQKLESDSASRLAAKLPSWAGLLVEVPAAINLQQCSGESAARYKASLIPEGSRVADLTGGLGVDSWAFSRRASVVWYNERDVVLRDAVRRNFVALGVSGVEFNSFDISPASDDWLAALREFGPVVIYLDPARRDAAGRKVFLLEDCSPDVVALMPLLLDIAPLVMVKVSPMADLTMLQRRLAPYLSEIHVVGSDGECKEILCLLYASGSSPLESPPKDFASLIPPTDVHCSSVSELTSSNRPSAGPSRSRGHGRPRSSEATPAFASPETSSESGVIIRLAEDGIVFDSKRIGLVESDDKAGDGDEGPALLSRSERSEARMDVAGPSVPAKASSDGVETEGGERLLFVPSAAMVKAGLGPGLCRMGYDEHLSHFGKFYRVLEEHPFSSSVIKELNRRYPQAEVTAKGLPLSSEDLRTKMKIKPGGPIHIFACILEGERRILICKKY